MDFDREGAQQAAYCVINKFLDKNKPLYTFFVDFIEAFDYVIQWKLL